MMERLKEWHRSLSPGIYMLGLAMLAVGLPLSKFLMSLGQFVLLGNWIIGGQLGLKFRRFFNNKVALAIASIYLLHLIGLLWTADFSYAMNDLRKKLPLLALPIILSSIEPFSGKRFRQVLLLFVLAVFAGTMVSMYHLLGFSGEMVTDMRNISVFISHIRFSLMICMATFILVYFVTYQKDHFSFAQRMLMSSLALWFPVFLIILESANGLIIFAITTLLIFIYYALKASKPWLRISFATIIALSIGGSAWYVYTVAEEYYNVDPINYEELDTHTKLGNPYTHDTSDVRVENGHHVWIYLSWHEMKDAWNKRSELDFDGKDKKGHRLAYTLARFLTSKGYRKDAEGVNKLSEKEIRAVENGIANYRYLDHFSFSDRIYQLIWEYENYKLLGDASGSSLMQRLEYWRAAIRIIKENPAIGVGTGDLNLAYQNQYEQMDTPLAEQWQRRGHNQYLTMAVAFGVIGGIWFLLALFYPIVALKFKPGFLLSVFYIIVLLSFTSEDTLETQAGATFFAFFLNYLLFMQPGIANKTDSM